MRERNRPPATYEDLKKVPQDRVAQLIAGDLHVLPRPSGAHANLITQLATDLVGPFQKGRGGPGGWVFLFEPELHLGADVVVPDVAGWRSERSPLDLVARQPFFTLSPDWVCEGLSDSTRSLDRVAKLGVYQRERVGWLWFADPVARTLEAFALRDGSYVLLGSWAAGSKARVPPFEALEYTLDEWWGIPRT